MKHALILLTFTLFGLHATAQNHKIEIKTSAICEMCQYAIEKDMAFEKGVKAAELDLDTKILSVEYNPKKTDPDKIRKRITLVGYNADDLPRDPEAYEKLPSCCKDGAHKGSHSPH